MGSPQVLSPKHRHSADTTFGVYILLVSTNFTLMFVRLNSILSFSGNLAASHLLDAILTFLSQIYLRI